MPQLFEPDDVVNAVITSLQTNLGSKISAINAAVTDGIVLETPPTHHYLKYEPSVVGDFPAIGVILQSTAPASPREANVLSIQHKRPVHHFLQISFIMVAREAVPNNLRIQVYRMARAVRDVMQADAQLSSQVGGWYWTSMEYGAVQIVPGGNVFIQEGRINTVVLTGAN